LVLNEVAAVVRLVGNIDDLVGESVEHFDLTGAVDNEVAEAGRPARTSVEPSVDVCLNPLAEADVPLDLLSERHGDLLGSEGASRASPWSGVHRRPVSGWRLTPLGTAGAFSG